jgi:predicted nucleotidyltransferase
VQPEVAGVARVGLLARRSERADDVHVDRKLLIERLTAVLRARAEIFEAYLFGSQARGDAHPGSDVDVAVFVDRARAPDAPFGYPAELATALASTCGAERVDVVVLNEAPPLLYHRVLRDGIRLFARDARAATTREGRALSRYCDYLPQLRKIEAAHSARIARGGFGR